MRRPRLKLTRDATLFALGVGAFTFEVLRGGDRPNVLYGAMALMGVAAYLRGTTIEKDDDKKPPT